MTGAIRKRDIIAHPFVTVSCFGWRIFFRAVAAGREDTFLSIVAQFGAARPQSSRTVEAVGRSIELELRAKRVYEVLAHRFCQHPEAEEFFSNLAVQEQEHAGLLQLCTAASERDQWIEGCFDPLRDVLSKLESRMTEAEHSLDALKDLPAALRFVIKIESCEINQTFQRILSATRSTFVGQLRAFQDATSRHFRYISNGIRNLEPSLQPKCNEMRAAYRHQVGAMEL